MILLSISLVRSASVFPSDISETVSRLIIFSVIILICLLPLCSLYSERQTLRGSVSCFPSFSLKLRKAVWNSICPRNPEAGPLWSCLHSQDALPAPALREGRPRRIFPPGSPLFLPEASPRQKNLPQ